MTTPAQLSLTAANGGTATVDGILFKAVNGNWVPVGDTGGGGISAGAGGEYTNNAALPNLSSSVRDTGKAQPFGPADGAAGENDLGYGRFTSQYTPTGPYSGSVFNRVQSPIVNEAGEVVGMVDLDPTQLGVDPYAANELAKQLGGTLVVNEGAGPLQLSIQFDTGENFNAGLLLERYMTYPKEQADRMTADEIRYSSVGGAGGGGGTGVGNTGSFTGLMGTLSFTPQAGGSPAGTVAADTPVSGTPRTVSTLPAGANTVVRTTTPNGGAATLGNGDNIKALAVAANGASPLLTVWQWNWYQEQATGTVGFDPVEMGLTTDQRYDFVTWWAANLRMAGIVDNTARPTGSVGGPGGTTIGGNGGGGTGGGTGGNGGGGAAASDSLFWAALKREGASFLLESVVLGAKAFRGPYWSKG